MTTVMPQQAAPARGYRRVPWSPRAWSQALYLAGGIPAQLAAPLIVFALLRWPGRFDFWVGPLFVLWLLVAAVALLLVPVLTWIQRHRLRVTAGIDIPPQPRRPDWLTRDGITETLRSQAYWRQAGYHFLAGPALAGAAIAAIGVWLAGVLFAFEYVYVWALSPDGALRRGTGGATSSSPLPLVFGTIPADVALTAAGVAGLLVAPFLSSAVASLDARAASALLGPSRAEELQHRVEHLTETRAGVVDAADAERRRLERDLHDGTQQRLVSLAMNLGMARAQASSAEEAQQAIAEAHEEAKAALAELRDLIRGLHPAVLEDRGLDAALSGVAARMPIPVRLTVDGLAAPPLTGDRGGRLLRGVRGTGQHRQARPGVSGGGVRATQRRPAARHRDRRRRGRRRPGPRHRPDGPGQARRVGGRDLRGRQPARRADRAFRGPAMRQVTAGPSTRGTSARGNGRWIWGVSGLVTLVALAVPGARLILNAGMPTVQGNVSAIPTSTVTITQPVTSLNVQSYGAPIQITTGSGPDVTVAEAISFSGDTAPAVTAQVAGGQLTLAAPACAQSDCSVGFTVTLPTRVPVTAASSGGDIIISGAAGASLDSGGGAVRATGITGSLGVTSEGGPVLLDGVAGANVDSGGGVVQAAGIYGQFTVSSEGDPVTVNGLTGALHADTGGGNLIAEGVSASTAAVTTEGGDARLGFATAPDSVQVDTGGGAADLSVPGGPYALTADDGGGGPELISIATNPAATRSINVSTNGGALRISAGAVGDSGSKAVGGKAVRTGPQKPPAPPKPRDPAEALARAGRDRAQAGGGAGELPAVGPHREQPPGQVESPHRNRAQRAGRQLLGNRERAEHGRADARGDRRLDRGRRRQLGDGRDALKAGLRAQRLLQVAPRPRARLAGHQRRGGQFGGGDARPPAGPRMPGRHHDGERVRPGPPGRESRRQVGTLHEPDVRRAAEDRRRHVGGIARGQRDRGFRVAAAQRRQPAGQQVLGDGHRRGDAQHRVAALPQRGDPRVERGRGVDRRLRPAGDQLAVRGQARAVRGPLDQRHAQPALEPPDAGAGGRLGDPVLPRRESEAAQPGYGEQQVERHQVGHPLIKSS